MSASLKHELRTPLNHIIGYCEMLMEEAQDHARDAWLPDLERIHAAGKRAFLSGPLVAGNEPDNWSQAAKLGFDAILTDYPLVLAKQLRSASP